MGLPVPKVKPHKAAEAHASFFVGIGLRIRRLREREQLTQEDMCALGFSLRHWQRIEHGKSFTMETLLRVSDALKATPEELVTGLYRVPKRR